MKCQDYRARSTKVPPDINYIQMTQAACTARSDDEISDVEARKKRRQDSLLEKCI